MKDNKGFASIAIIAIIVGVLVVIGGVYYLGKNSKTISENIKVDNSQTQENQNPSVVTNDKSSLPQNLVSNKIADKDWRVISNNDLLKITSTTSSEINPNPIIKFSEAIDLTGDGINEGIFATYGVDSVDYIILIKNADNTITLAKEKNKNGIIETIFLQVSKEGPGYKLLPQENGFYQTSKYYDENTNKLTCVNDEVAAYKWNSQTRLFEYNQILSAKYTPEVCK